MDGFSNTGEVINLTDAPEPSKMEPTQQEKELVAFVVDHTDKWREYRDQNHLDDWNR